jgi:secreted trypsin-like serine protease
MTPAAAFAEREERGINSQRRKSSVVAAACGYANAFGVYTRIANYKDWIAKKTGSDDAARSGAAG